MLLILQLKPTKEEKNKHGEKFIRTIYSISLWNLRSMCASSF